MQILYFIIKKNKKTYLSTYNDNIIFAITIVDCIIRFLSHFDDSIVHVKFHMI